MGVASDIIDGIEDILQSIIDKGFAKLLEVVIAGFTLVMSAPAIALATIFNDEPGYIDPLLLPPFVVSEQYWRLDRVGAGALECSNAHFKLESPPALLATHTKWSSIFVREDTGLLVTYKAWVF